MILYTIINYYEKLTIAAYFYHLLKEINIQLSAKIIKPNLILSHFYQLSKQLL